MRAAGAPSSARAATGAGRRRCTRTCASGRRSARITRANTAGCGTFMITKPSRGRRWSDGEVPGDGRAPVVADQQPPPGAGGVEQGGDVLHQLIHAIGGASARPAGAAIAAQVRRDRAPALSPPTGGAGSARRSGSPESRAAGGPRCRPRPPRRRGSRGRWRIGCGSSWWSSLADGGARARWREARDEEVVVVGAGIAGLCVALALAPTGRRVTLLERDPPPPARGPGDRVRRLEAPGRQPASPQPRLPSPPAQPDRATSIQLAAALHEAGARELAFARRPARAAARDLCRQTRRRADDHPGQSPQHPRMGHAPPCGGAAGRHHPLGRLCRAT